MKMFLRATLILVCSTLMTGCLGLGSNETVVDPSTADTPLKDGQYKVEILHPKIITEENNIPETVTITRSKRTYTKTEHTGPYNEGWPTIISFALESIGNNFYIMTTKASCGGIFDTTEFCNYLVMKRGNDLYQWMTNCNAMDEQYGIKPRKIATTKTCTFKDAKNIRKVLRTLRNRLMKLPRDTRHYSAMIRYSRAR